MRVRTMSLLLVTTLSTACYRYSTTQVDSVMPRAQVRARITDSEAERLAPLLGRSLRSLHGTVITSGGDSLLLEVPATGDRALAGGTIQPLHQRVAISRSGIQELERKQLNRSGTFALIGAGAIAVGYVLLRALDVIGGPPPPDGGVPPEFRGLRFPN
jgi:hypothetical protein